MVATDAYVYELVLFYHLCAKPTNFHCLEWT